MKKTILLAILLNAFHASAKLAVISDVDDTIKISQISSTAGAVVRAFDTHSAYAGMSEVYHLIKQNNQDADFIYLSKAPSVLMEDQHKLFLQNNFFPSGKFYGSLFGESNFKVNKIIKIMEKHNYDELILIGDNTEQDPKVYTEIKKLYPKVKIHILIHHVLSSEYESFVEYQTHKKEQWSEFVTSIELMVLLNKLGILNIDHQFGDLYKKMVNQLLAENDLVLDTADDVFIPDFVTCFNFKWELGSEAKNNYMLGLVQKLIQDRCYLK